MGTPVGAIDCVRNGQGEHLVSSIKTRGVREGATLNGQPLSPEQQQFLISQRDIQNQPKGSLLSVTIFNDHATDSQAFILFDPNGIAAASGATATGADIEITTTFAGGVPYTALKTWMNGSHFASIGTMFQFTDVPMITTSMIKVWNGNIEDYNGKNLSNYLNMAKDTWSNDQKVLIMGTTLYMNGFMAMTGIIPAKKQIDILFNVTLFNNF